MKTGIEEIIEERQEQINKHGFTPNKDQAYENGELIKVAFTCLMQDENLKDGRGFRIPGGPVVAEDFYPRNWQRGYLGRIERKSRINQLRVAGAMIAAEIDRLKALQESAA